MVTGDGSNGKPPVDRHRRRMLAAFAAAAATSTAGCSVSLRDGSFEVNVDGDVGSDGSAGGETDNPGRTEETSTEAEDEETASDVQAGGTPVVGIPGEVATLNPLVGSSGYEQHVIELLHTEGTTFSPSKQRFEPWGFERWQLVPGNVGTSNPTVTATLRDGLTFNDGEPVTAEDVKFTVEYIKQHNPPGISAHQFEAVQSVGVDSPTGRTVNYYLSESDPRWFTSVLGTPVLPKHVWSRISDPEGYAPMETGGRVVGAGPMVLDDYREGRWIELSMRPRSEIPWNTAQGIDWLHDDGPFIDGLRFELFDSEETLHQAVLDGNVDVAWGSVSTGDAAQVMQQSHLALAQSEEHGWNHHSYNLRRVPLDDPAFRQWLVKLTDKTWAVEELKDGIGARKGSYATGYPYEDWRPPEPPELQEYEGIPIPDLSFPGDSGSFQLDQDGIERARGFLETHPAAKHDYAFLSAPSSYANPPDGKILHVNGQPLEQAHTDNDGNGGQGPIELNFNPPQEDEDEARFAQQTIGIYNQVGLPTVGKTETQNSQIPVVYGAEDFDIYAMGWNADPLNLHFESLFSSSGADLDGSQSAPMFNAMGYTGADDLITHDSGLMAPGARQPVVKQILAEIYRDAPTNVVWHDRTLQPVNNRFTGWVTAVGGVINKSNWLNLRRRG